MIRAVVATLLSLSCTACGTFLAAETTDQDASVAIDGSTTSEAGRDDGGVDAAAKDAALPAPILGSVITLGSSTAQIAPVGVAVGASSVFMADGSGVILSRPKDTSVSNLGTVIYGSLAAPQFLTLFGAEVFWTELGAGTVTRALASGGVDKTITGSVPSATGIAIAGDTTWVTAMSTGNIYAFARDSSDAKPMPATSVPGNDRPVGIAIGAGLLFVALQGTNEIVSFEIGTPTNPRKHVVSIDMPSGLAFDDAQSVFYATSQSGDPTKRGVYRWTVGATAAEYVVATEDLPAGIAFDDQYVYWVTRGTAGKLWRADKK